MLEQESLGLGRRAEEFLAWKSWSWSPHLSGSLPWPPFRTPPATHTHTTQAGDRVDMDQGKPARVDLHRWLASEPLHSLEGGSAPW